MQRNFFQQITFELNKHAIQDFIKEGANISDVRNHILQKQTESMIVQTRFDARSTSIAKQEVKDQIEAHSDQMVIDLVSEQEGQTVITEVKEQDTQDVIHTVLETLRQELRTLVQDMSGQQHLPLPSPQPSVQSGQTSNYEPLPTLPSVQRALVLVPQDGRDASDRPNKAVSKRELIAAYLGTLSQDEQIYYWNHLDALASQFETGTKTAQRAFEAYPTAKQKRRAQ